MNQYILKIISLSFLLYIKSFAEQQPQIVFPSFVENNNDTHQQNIMNENLVSSNQANIAPNVFSEKINQTQNYSEIRGCINIKGNHEKIPQFRIIYEGKIALSNNEGFFSIPIEQGTIEECSLIICRNIDHEFNKTNTINHASIRAKTKYRLFSYKSSPLGNKWQEEKTNSGKEKFVIPKHCIIILIDVDLIQGIEPWNINLNNNVIKLPVILLKNEPDTINLEEASAKSLLHSLHLKRFHEPITQEIKQSLETQKIEISR